jgi:protein O-mannosyl-transferase
LRIIPEKFSKTKFCGYFEMITEKQKAWLVACLIIIIGSVIYANTLNVPFHFDDKDNIQNAALRVESLDAEQFKKALSDGTLKTRPISNLSFAFNYFIGQYRVQGYHLVNIGIHIFTGIFLYFLLLVTFNLAVIKRHYANGSAIALMTSLLWVAHPVATQSVTYIVQRMNSMAAMFFVLAMLLYALGRSRQISGERKNYSVPNWALLVGSGLSGFLAIGSKEIAATLPLFIFLYEWYFFQDLNWGWLKKKLYWLVGSFLVMGGIAFIYTNGQIFNVIANSCSDRDFSTMERVFTQFRVVIYYISLIFYPNPDRLSLDYNFPISVSLLSPPTTLLSLLVLVVLIGLAIVLARRERLLSFCILWFFGNLVIESSVICLEIIFEHRTYLPSMFLILLFVASAYRYGRHAVPVTVVLLSVAVLLGYWTFERNKIWKTPLALWADSVSKHPGKARTHGNLAVAYAEKGDIALAEEEYKRALILFQEADKLDPKIAIAHGNLGNLYMRHGRKQEAEMHLREAIRIKPDYVRALLNFGVLKREQGVYEEAIDAFRKAWSVVPQNGTVNKNLGNALLRNGRSNDALPYLQKALSESPDDLEILLDLGECLASLGRIEEAIETYNSILKKDRNHGSAHYHLALLSKWKGQPQQALAHYREANRLLQYPADIKYDYANLLLRQGEIKEAEKLYREFINPSLAKAYNNLGLALLSQGKYKDAVKNFKTALTIDPSFQMAADNMRAALEELKTSEDEKNN